MTRGLRRGTSIAATLGLVLSGAFASAPAVRADAVAQTLPFSQNWANTGMITVNDNWSGCARRSSGTAATTLTPRHRRRPADDRSLDGARRPSTSSRTRPTRTRTTGGVAEFDGITNPVVALQGSGTARLPVRAAAPEHDRALQNIQVAYNLRDIDGSTDNAVQPVALQFRVGDSGNFTNVPAGFVADATTGPSLATLVTPVSVTLPARRGQPAARPGAHHHRRNAVGIDEWVGVDDINVTGAPLGPTGIGNANPNPVTAGDSTLLTVSTTPAGSPIVSVVADLTAIGGSASQAFVDDGTGGDAVPGDGIWSYTAAVPSNTTAGNKSLPATITDQLARTGTCTISLDVLAFSTPPSGVGAASPSIVPIGDPTRLTVAVTPGTNPASSNIQVTADLSSIGGSSTQAFFDDGTNGDTTPGDNMFTFVATIGAGTTPGSQTLPATITDLEGRTGTATISLTVTAGVPPIVISQVYAGGGEGGATFRNDYVELFNRGTAPADLSGWSVQSTTANGTTWEVTPLSGILAPGRYFLVQQASGGGSGALLPVADATGTSNLTLTAGKVLLIRTTTTQSGSCPGGTTLMDLVGYGAGADCFEGSGPAAAGTPSLASLRLLSGCADNNDNAADFSAEAPTPRNTSTTATDCSAPPNPPTLYPIDMVQGSGTSSPLVGQVVRVRGIVTGRTSNTYFLQTPDGSADEDGDPGTSEGLIVFTSSAPTVAVGQFVESTGTVSEFIPSADPSSPPKTEITQAAVTVFSSGNPLPAPVTITAADTDPSGTIEQLEKYEAMRVRVASLTVIGPSQGTVNEPNANSTNNGVFYGVVDGVARPFREPGIEVPLPIPPGAPPNIPRFDANPERIRVDSDLQTGTVPLDVASGATVGELVGPLDYSFRAYTIAADGNPPPTVTGGITATPVPVPAANQFTVASYNMERFFDTVNDPGIGEPVLTTTAFNNRLNKLSLYVRNVLRTPDIIGVQEIENLTTLQTVAAKINGDAVAAGDPDPSYVAYLEEGNDIGGIDVGFLVKCTRVTVVERDAGGQGRHLHRPQQRTARAAQRPAVAGAAGARARARIGARFPGDGHRQPPALAERRRRPRRRQPRAHQAPRAGRVPGQPDPGAPGGRSQRAHRLIGDFNAFQFNDGYVDSVGTIRGQPTPADQVVLASPDLVDPDLVNLQDTMPPDQRYSFVFDGNAQTLDHALVSQNILPLVADYRRGRGNADSPETLRGDATRPERLADHDPLVAYFLFGIETQTSLASSANPSTFGQPVTFTAAVTAGANPVTQGSVTFKDGTQVLAIVNLNASGQAAFTTSTLSGGPHPISAQYGGSSTFNASAASLTQTVNAQGTTTTLASSLNPSGFGQSVTFTASVKVGTTPVTEGSVTFREGTTVLAGPLALDGSGQASFSASLALGTHVITADYAGTANFQASAGSFTQTVQPGITVNDVFVMEGDAPNTVAAVFNVSLSAASTQPVSVSFATQNGTAIAGSDYAGRSGAITFPAGSTSRTVAIVILSDVLNEADETFFVALSGAANGVVVDSQGVGTILNDDPLPTLTIRDVTVAEASGPAVFTVALNAPSGRTVTVDFATADGTAVAPGDYVTTNGTLTFPAGTISRTISVTVNRDGIPEPAENFYVVLGNAVNAGLADGLSICTIRRSGELGGSTMTSAR